MARWAMTAVAALACAATAAWGGRADWRCPGLSARPAAECACDMPRTLRCAGDHTALHIIGRHLREQRTKNKNNEVSLLDCALRGVTALTSASVAELSGVGLHGLVISSGDIRRVQHGAFISIATTLQALGLPNNQLPSVPTDSLLSLPKLDRLDLSNNKIHTLDASSFKGIQNITYLDLSDNQLRNIAPDTFRSLTKLSVLRLRGNVLEVTTLSSLREARSLRELDLSSNALEGPLNADTVPLLGSLVSLQLSDNAFSSIRKGALNGLTNITYLNLQNNRIDVLEDFAFTHLTNLTHLDLSHNGIVAVSGASLAQLSNLVRLDLSHNFLRSLSAEPLKSLDKLADLLVHDNDISMIDDGALADHTDLRRFTIEDNPLNCDCLMAGFARWLREAKNLSQSDQSAAICATPPHLEGALLSRLSKSKLCDDFDLNDQTRSQNDVANGHTEEYDYNAIIGAHIPVKFKDDGESDGLNDDIYDEELDVPSEDDLPISKAKVHLLDAWFDSQEVHLSWAVDSQEKRHRCTGMTVARGTELPRHLACHRSPPQNVVLQGFKINPMEQYTFCIALEEMDNSDTPTALVLGCAPAQLIRPRAAFVTAPIPTIASPVVRDHIRVSEVRSNVTSDGLLTVLISLMGFSEYPLPRSQRLSSEQRYISTAYNCYVVLAVLTKGSLVAQKDTPCRQTLEISMEGFVRGPYEVCATLSKTKSEETAPICIVPQLMEDIGSMEMKSSFKGLNTALVGISLGLMVLVIGLVWFVRRMLKKPVEFEPHRCFRQEPLAEETTRANYVMLTATSKV